MPNRFRKSQPLTDIHSLEAGKVYYINFQDVRGVFRCEAASDGETGTVIYSIGGLSLRRTDNDTLHTDGAPSEFRLTRVSDAEVSPSLESEMIPNSIVEVEADITSSEPTSTNVPSASSTSGDVPPETSNSHQPVAPSTAWDGVEGEWITEKPNDSNGPVWRYSRNGHTFLAKFKEYRVLDRDAYGPVTGVDSLGEAEGVDVSPSGNHIAFRKKADRPLYYDGVDTFTLGSRFSVRLGDKLFKFDRIDEKLLATLTYIGYGEHEHSLRRSVWRGVRGITMTDQDWVIVDNYHNHGGYALTAFAGRVYLESPYLFDTTTEFHAEGVYPGGITSDGFDTQWQPRLVLDWKFWKNQRTSSYISMTHDAVRIVDDAGDILAVVSSSTVGSYDSDGVHSELYKYEFHDGTTRPASRNLADMIRARILAYSSNVVDRHAVEDVRERRNIAGRTTTKSDGSQGIDASKIAAVLTVGEPSEVRVPQGVRRAKWSEGGILRMLDDMPTVDSFTLGTSGNLLALPSNPMTRILPTVVAIKEGVYYSKQGDTISPVDGRLEKVDENDGVIKITNGKDVIGSVRHDVFSDHNAIIVDETGVTDCSPNDVGSFVYIARVKGRSLATTYDLSKGRNVLISDDNKVSPDSDHSATCAEAVAVIERIKSGEVKVNRQIASVEPSAVSVATLNEAFQKVREWQLSGDDALLEQAKDLLANEPAVSRLDSSIKDFIDGLSAQLMAKAGSAQAYRYAVHDSLHDAYAAEKAAAGVDTRYDDVIAVLATALSTAPNEADILSKLRALKEDLSDKNDRLRRLGTGDVTKPVESSASGERSYVPLVGAAALLAIILNKKKKEE